MAGSRTGMDVGCNDSPARLPAAVLAPRNGVNTIVGVVWADTSGDGLADMVILLSNGSLLLAANDGHFAFATTVALLASNVAAFAVLDIDADGFVDIVAYTTSGIGVTLFNVGGGGFSLRGVPALPAVAGVLRVVPVDVNGDGFVDIVVLASSIHVLINTGAGLAFSDQVGASGCAQTCGWSAQMLVSVADQRVCMAFVYMCMRMRYCLSVCACAHAIPVCSQGNERTCRMHMRCIWRHRQ